MALGYLIGMGFGLVVALAIILWGIWSEKIVSGKHAKRNCDNEDCPMNKPNGKFRKCGIDILSLIDGRCEFWEAYKESKRLDQIDAMRGDKVV